MKPDKQFLREFLAAQIVAAAVLAATLHTVWTRIDGATSSDALNKKLTFESLVGTALAQDLVAYLLAITLLHLCVGVAGQLVARLFTSLKGGVSELRRVAASAAATGGLFVWAQLANAAAFSWSRASGGPWATARWELAGVSVFEAVTAIIVLVLGAAVGTAIFRSRVYRMIGPRLIVYPLVGVLTVAAWRVTGLASADTQEGLDKPHIIIIGIDSLRPDAVGRGDATAFTPNIDRFLAEAARFDDTVTPLARTFPAWISILTGQHPVTTGARENLLAPARLNLPATLGDTLKADGYRAVYATDEVRSSNIDESYGFDEVIGPRIGALDFVLAAVNDLPLSNVVANSVLGKILFPYTYMNRGAAITYRPETFVREIDSNVAFDEPTFLAVHLTLPHWPYHWAADNQGTLAESLRQPYTYSSSLLGVDKQFGDLLEVLERKGALANAVVVLLSDHGEALGFPGDNLLQSAEAKLAARGITVTMWGHGNSVLSPPQYDVLMAWRGFGNQTLGGGRGRWSTPASLEDIAPTLVDLLGLRHEGAFDGVSLAKVLRTGEGSESATRDRVRFTESGITVGFTRLGEAKVEELVEKGMSAYAIDPRSGRLELKDEYFADLMSSKERAAIGPTYLVAALPASDGTQRFLAIPRTGGMPRFLHAPPDAAADAELRRLWDALMARYAHELGRSPVS